LSAHALRSTDPTTPANAGASAPAPDSTPAPESTPAKDPTSVKLLKNADLAVLALALVIFLVTGLPISGWIAATVGWLLQRIVNELAVRKAIAAEDVRTRVGLLAGSMILRGWIVVGALAAVGIGDRKAGLSAAIVVLAVFTLQFALTMAMRPFEVAAAKSKAKAEAKAEPNGGARS
jgi:hypothetical protein